MTTWSSDFLIEFIDLFREQEPLWKTKHKDYHNNVKRNSCYEILLRKMKEIDNTADINKVKTKIRNLRTVFKKELNKQNDSLASGTGADEVYTPKLSYFENLMFLKDQEIRYEGKSSTHADVFPEVADHHEDSNENPSEVQSSNGSQSQDNDKLPPPPTPNAFKRKKSSQVSSAIDVTLENINNKIVSIKPDDACDVFGKNVASKLKSLPKDQRIWAEKIINDTLLEAEFGNLNRQTVAKINNILNNFAPNWQPPTSPYSQPPTSPYSQPPTSPYSQPPASPYSQPPASPYSQPPTSPYSQSPTSSYSQPHTSKYCQPQTSPYSQPPASPYSQSPTSSYSQPHTSKYCQPQTSSYSQPHTSKYCQPQTSAYSQPPASTFLQAHLSREIPPTEQEIKSPPLSRNVPLTQEEIQSPPQELIILHIPEDQPSQPQTHAVQARHNMSPRQEQNIFTFFQNFES